MSSLAGLQCQAHCSNAMLARRSQPGAPTWSSLAAGAPGGCGQHHCVVADRTGGGSRGGVRVAGLAGVAACGLSQRQYVVADRMAGGGRGGLGGEGGGSRHRVGRRRGSRGTQSGGLRPVCVALEPGTTAPVKEEGPQDISPEHARFQEAARQANLVPLCRRIFSDHLTPVLAYRCLVSNDERDAPSCLFESVEDGSKAGRYSIIGTQPRLEIIAKEELAIVLDHDRGTREERIVADPMATAVELSAGWKAADVPGLPNTFCGGWVGYFSYDTVRYVEAKKLPFSKAPVDDRGLPDIHLGLYDDVVVFDHVTKIVYAVHWVHTYRFSSTEEAFRSGRARVESLVRRLQPDHLPNLPPGAIDLSLDSYGASAAASNMSEADFRAMVCAAKEHILAGDIFQIVLSQRFERRTFADPFEVYRALRIVNPSPYMIYLQARGCILVASSPEILCRIKDGSVVNRPLAGTRRRGATVEEDVALEKDLLADEKEVAEHVMLVDLGRNDVGKVSKAGTVKVEKLMEVERYSHVMHISSTVTGEVLDGLSCWDALRAALPVGTVSGAPKVRAMELIDEFEPTRRGPYSGGVGVVSYAGDMDIALALRTMVFPSAARHDSLYAYGDAGSTKSESTRSPRREWMVHLQAGAGIVADSDPAAEYQETVNKAAALGRAIDLAEASLVSRD